jgi:hypothetical protein
MCVVRARQQPNACGGAATMHDQPRLVAACANRRAPTRRGCRTRTVLSTHSNTSDGVLLSGSRTTSSSLMMLGPLDRFCGVARAARARRACVHRRG